jgi:hypothetical protein
LVSLKASIQRRSSGHASGAQPPCATIGRPRSSQAGGSMELTRALHRAPNSIGPRHLDYSSRRCRNLDLADPDFQVSQLHGPE